MAAETVDSQLRNTVRAARSRSLRCVKAIIVKKGSALSVDTVPAAYTLALANSLPEEAGVGLDKEFQRCVKSLLEPEKPCLLLFRADLCENIDSSRWLLLAWLPEAAAEVDRARYVRSRGLMADLVQQPYFLNELFAKDVQSLSWPAATRAMTQARLKDPEGLALSHVAPISEEFLQAPLRFSQAAQGLLQRLVQKEDSCLKFTLASRLSLSRLAASGEASAANSPSPVMEAKVMDCQSPAQLAKAELPSTSCFFALYTRDDLVFVHWCPDRLSRDPSARMRDDSRYAVLKPTVQRLVMSAFPVAPRLLLVDAREPQDLVDGANRAADANVAKQADSKQLTPAARGGYLATEPSWPGKSAKADWPLDWPKEATTAVAMPSGMTFPMRPVPPWRGGSKAHTISTASSSVSAVRAKLGRKTLREASM